MRGGFRPSGSSPRERLRGPQVPDSLTAKTAQSLLSLAGSWLSGRKRRSLNQDMQELSNPSHPILVLYKNAILVTTQRQPLRISLFVMGPPVVLGTQPGNPLHLHGLPGLRRTNTSYLRIHFNNSSTISPLSLSPAYKYLLRHLRPLSPVSRAATRPITSLEPA